MPELPPVEGGLRVVMDWQVDDDTTANTVHYFSITGNPNPGNCATMADSFVTLAQDAFAALCLGTVGVNYATVTDLSDPGAGQGVAGTPWLGTATGTRLPPGAAFLVNHQIARRYRGGKPRTYLPVGKAEDIDTSGLWTEASVNAVGIAWGSFANDAPGIGAGCTIEYIENVSYYKGNTVYIDPVTGRARNVSKVRPTPVQDKITGHTVSLKIASQRRRNRKA